MIRLDAPVFLYYLVRVAAHGGGVVSRHLDGAHAERKAAKYRRKHPCMVAECPCVEVVSQGGYSKLPSAREGDGCRAARP